MKEGEKILIFGISGQDGSYLAEHYLEKQNIIVHGVVRRLDSNPNIDHLDQWIEKKRLVLHQGDITDSLGVGEIIDRVRPSKIVNLAGQTYVASSFDIPLITMNTNTNGILHILQAIRKLKLANKVKLFHALTSEMFGDVAEGTILNQQYPMNPVSPYAVAKRAGFDLIKNYRKKAFGMNISCSISFNHQSPRRGKQFVTRKVTQYVAKVYVSHLSQIEKKMKYASDPLYLGNINSYRDWGHAKDYVKAFDIILNQPESQDYVICTGRSYSVRQLVQIAFKFINIQIGWQGQKQNEEGYDKKTNQIYVKIDSQLYRPNEVPYLRGDSTKFTNKTGWKASIKFEEMIKQMIENDIKILSMEKYQQTILQKNGL